MQQLEFDRIPQPVPRARVDSINKPMPQLRERGLDPFAQGAEQRTPLTHRIRRQQQQLGLGLQHLAQRDPTIAEISQRDSTLDKQRKGRGGITVITIGRGQHRPDQLARQISSGAIVCCRNSAAVR